MHLFYNIGIFFLGIGIRVLSIFNSKAKAWVQGRKNIFKKLPKVDGKKVIWFHCASLGEFDQGLPLMNLLKKEQPSSFLLVTFFSPSGMKHYSKREQRVDYAMYLPLDTSSNASSFIHHFQPAEAYFIKYEFWSNFIFKAKSSGTKIYNVSGIFRPNHHFFKWYGGFFRKTLRAFNWFFVQNETSLHLLNSIGIKNVTISGDSRFDRVIENKNHFRKNEILEQFKNDMDVFIVGSSWPEDDKVLIPWINNQRGKVIIAPHTINKNHIDQLLNKIQGAVRYSQIDETKVHEVKVLILDTIGLLANAYAYGNIAYVGGGFAGSLHNILEPAVFGLPVVFGPKHTRFPEAQNFIDAGIGFTVENETELKSTVKKILSNIKPISEKTLEFIDQNQGAVKKIYERITSN